MPRIARFLVLALAVALPIAACGSQASATPATTLSGAGAQPASLPAEVDVADADQLRRSGSLVLDVREPSEWADGHIDGATLIPLGELQARLGELPRDRSIVVVCRSGNRSAQGRDILLGAGFTAVTSMAGGMSAWTGAGLPVVTGT